MRRVKTDLREDPFNVWIPCAGEFMNDGGGNGYMNSFFAREFWRFIMMQQAVATLAQSAIDFPPMQAGEALVSRKSRRGLKQQSARRAAGKYLKLGS